MSNTIPKAKFEIGDLVQEKDTYKFGLISKIEYDFNSQTFKYLITIDSELPIVESELELVKSRAEINGETVPQYNFHPRQQPDNDGDTEFLNHQDPNSKQEQNLIDSAKDLANKTMADINDINKTNP